MEKKTFSLLPNSSEAAAINEVLYCQKTISSFLYVNDFSGFKVRN